MEKCKILKYQNVRIVPISYFGLHIPFCLGVIIGWVSILLFQMQVIQVIHLGMYSGVSLRDHLSLFSMNTDFNPKVYYKKTFRSPLPDRSPSNHDKAEICIHIH